MPNVAAMVPPQRGWWQRVFGPPVPASPPPVPPPARPRPAQLHQRQEPAEPILVPAKGDAFDFRVHAVYNWTGRDMSVQELHHRIDRYGPWAAGIVREIAASLARQHEPHRSPDLEWALNERLAGESWPKGPQRGPSWFSAQVRVRPDDRIRERLRPYWEERIRLECDHELAMLRTAQADELTRRWREVLQALEQDPVTWHAARLTGQQFAEVFGQFVDERRQAVPSLVALLEQAVKGHGELALGPSEYTEAWDAALRTYRQQHGLVDQG